MVSDTSRNLRRVFKLSEALKAQAPKDLDWKPLRVHVIGAGTMGADIAGCVRRLRHGSDAAGPLAEEQIAKGHQGAGKLFARKFRTKAAARRGQSPPDRRSARARASARADVVIEAIVEKLEVKQALFKELEGKMKPGAVHGDQHILDHDRGHRSAARRSRPSDRHPLLQSRRADAAGRSDPRREHARGGSPARAAPSSPPSTSSR